MTRSTRLHLANYESAGSRYMFVFAEPDVSKTVEHSGVLRLGSDERERFIWRTALAGDLVSLLSPDGGSVHVLACRTRGKGLIRAPESVANSRPLELYVDTVGAGHLKGAPLEVAYPKEALAPRIQFQEIWERCTPDTTHSAPRHDWSQTVGSYTATIAQHRADFEFIKATAALHPFGIANAFVSLILWRDAERVGAVLLDPADNTNHHIHSASWRIFPDTYATLRPHAVEVRRLYSTRTVSRWRAHKALLELAIEIAPSIARAPISLLEGASYDFHPVATKLGFHVEIPRRSEDSFYYWRLYNSPSTDALAPSEPARDENFRSRVSQLLRRRHGRKYWLIWTREDSMNQALAKQAWALHRNTANTGRWRMVEPGDQVFFAGQDRIIRARGHVAAREMRSVSGLERFPLWIDFADTIATGVELNIAEALRQPWFRRVSDGGIAPLPPEFGARINIAVEDQLRNRRMWVEPNPYLLQDTQFDVIPKQVFVVQAAALQERVLPVIRTNLESHGYTVKYWGDRGGQVVLADIWLMLNESEATVVDFTNRPPNVYLEYGMALVLGKPIVAITQRAEDIPSNTPNLKYIVYADALNDKRLQVDLPRALANTIADIDRLRNQKLHRTI